LPLFTANLWKLLKNASVIKLGVTSTGFIWPIVGSSGGKQGNIKIPHQTALFTNPPLYTAALEGHCEITVSLNIYRMNLRKVL